MWFLLFPQVGEQHPAEKCACAAAYNLPTELTWDTFDSQVFDNKFFYTLVSCFFDI